MRSSRLNPATLNKLFAADRQPLAALRATALQNQPTVFGAHTNEKPVRADTMAIVRLKSTLALHDIPSRVKRTANVSRPVPSVSTRSGLC
jgi:hypothetical protein